MSLVTAYDETAILRELANGSIDAFDHLYLRYFDPVCAQTRELTKSMEVAEDIVQEVFLRLWERRENFANYRNIAGWLFVCSHNGAVSYLRKASRNKERHAEIGYLHHWVSEEEVVKQERLYELLLEAIEHLPPQGRAVFELCRLQGKSYEETANLLSISKNTVKEHVKKCYAFIRNYVQPATGSSIPILIMLSWPPFR